MAVQQDNLVAPHVALDKLYLYCFQTSPLLQVEFYSSLTFNLLLKDHLSVQNGDNRFQGFDFFRFFDWVSVQ